MSSRHRRRLLAAARDRRRHRCRRHHRRRRRHARAGTGRAGAHDHPRLRHDQCRQTPAHRQRRLRGAGDDLALRQVPSSARVLGRQPFATWRGRSRISAPSRRCSGDIPSERIAALEPDLIMATNAGLDRETYDRLAEISPRPSPTTYAEWNTPATSASCSSAGSSGWRRRRCRCSPTCSAFADTRAEHQWAELTAATRPCGTA